MSKFIYTGGMSLWLSAIFLGLVVGLAGCASDHGYDGYDGQYSRSRNDGSGKTWQDRAFERGNGGTRFITGDPASDILAGGL